MKPENARHDRLMKLPPVLRGGFRPFFLGASLWAVVVVTLWLMALHGVLTLPTRLDPLAWHRHEMLFGYLSGVVAGFALTAIPNWTGRLPVAGYRLAVLAGVWLAARLAVLFSAAVGALPAMALDVGFLVLLAAVAAREIIVARNRNLPLVAGLGILAVACARDHAEALGWASPSGLGWRFGFAAVLMLVALIGGRIIPSFTRNWLMKQGQAKGLPTQPDRFDALSLVLMVCAMLGWAVWPDDTGTAWLLVSAGAVQMARLARWSGLRTIREPIVFVLHVSYLWLPVGLALLGASHFVWCVPAAAALHALSAGAMASMTVAVMSRATLGHTGRALHADRATVAVYVLLTAGALVRFAATSLPFDYLFSITTAGMLWGGAFLLFAIRYASLWLGSRPDGKP